MEGLGSHDPRWIGGYRLLGRLGEGGMGRVYLARSERGRTVAVKAVKAELARQPDFRRRFALEIAAARRVGGEWTAPVLDADTEAAEPWVATGYIAGPSLAQVVDHDYGPLPEQSALALASGLIRALTAIHAAGLVHRDLKPSNVLITFDGPRVIDFGIARAVDAALQSSGGLTSTGAVIGSPGFMSPEQVRGTPVTAACDVFCLGAVLAYAATGRMPFGTADSGIHALMFRIAEEEADLTGIEGRLRDLITACLAKDPAQRPSLGTLAGWAGDELSGTWLPGEVLAQLGRHAVQLLDSEDPEAAAAVRAPASSAGTATGPGLGAGTGTPPPGPYRPPGPPPSAYGVPGTPPGPAASATPGPYGYPQPRPWSPGPTPPPGPHHTGYRTTSPYGPGTVGPGPRPAAGQQRAGAAPSGPPRSPRGLATATWTLLAAVLAWTVLDLLFSFAAYGTYSDYADSWEPTLVPDYDGLKAWSVTLDVLAFLVALPLITLWLMWFWRVRLNAEAFRPGVMRYGPGMAIGGWFLPVANLWIPKQIADDIWAACAPPAPGRPAWNGAGPHRTGLLNGWWTMWLTSSLIGSLLGWQEWHDASTALEARGWLVWGIVTDLLLVPATILAILVVLRLTRAQETRMSRTHR
ncbi:DUF4328 domain-containing protein [Streptomyces sp. RKND-216]|uniref:protein kinase domain-containing protein n=1 Tax=Streptomyces sp. RKND-216 TaxID=2562581 RepID=UPI00109DE618|nr:DUF4328 domain-containing protein [Streptomyces sp. RKND-216]THA25604.1 DUF4328 domain-containing protein [Streptomyces sp. RKND-216]